MPKVLFNPMNVSMIFSSYLSRYMTEWMEELIWKNIFLFKSFILFRSRQILFSKGPDSKYFQICGPYGLCHTIQLCHYSVKAAMDNTKVMGVALSIKHLEKQAMGRPGLWAGLALLFPDFGVHQNDLSGLRRVKMPWPLVLVPWVWAQAGFLWLFWCTKVWEPLLFSLRTQIQSLETITLCKSKALLQLRLPIHSSGNCGVLTTKILIRDS